jgi:hypothetical protein
VGCDRPVAFQQLNATLEQIKTELVSFLKKMKQEGKRIAGYGASATVTTLMHHFELGDLIDFIIDDDKTRQGLFSPGFHIPVVSAAALAERKPDYVVVLAWQYAKPIIQKNQAYIQQGGHFVIPMPKLEII